VPKKRSICKYAVAVYVVGVLVGYHCSKTGKECIEPTNWEKCKYYE